MKAKVNILNYENYWKNYLNGNLSESLEQELFNFLDSNPILYNKLVDDDELKLEAPAVQYENKSDLYAENQIDNLLISKLEGVISEENDKYITQKIESEESIKAEFEQYKKTRLHADKNIQLPNKKKLKKSVSIPLYQRISAVAAIFLVLYVAGIYVFQPATELNIESAQFSEFRQIEKDLRTPELISNRDITTENTADVVNESNQNAEIFKERVAYSKSGYKLEKLKRMPIQTASVLPVNLDRNFDSMRFRDNIYASADDSDAVRYTVEYSTSKQDSRLRTSLNQILETGREINITESIQNLRDKRDELFITMLNK